MSDVLRLGTRRSALAVAQAKSVGAAIAERSGCPVELVELTTLGDTDRRAITEFGGTGVFVSALRDALLAESVDFAVHSLKDLPTAPADGLLLAAVPPREDPRDALVARDGLLLAELPAGARVGTGSPRRAGQLRWLGLGLEVVPVRGNVDSRLRLVRDGELDAVVVARAGLARLGRLDEATEFLDPLQVLPAPGQGALAVECRATDPDTAALLAGLDDAPTRAAVTAERALLAALAAGCAAPVGALAEVAEADEEGDPPELYLRAVVVTVDGSASVRMSATGRLADAEGVGRSLAADMLADGADALIGERLR
jgi:hydroxymethylbilane synthase